MDDRGTPINKGPSIGNKDLNLYKLFKIVQNFGGYNKVRTVTTIVSVPFVCISMQAVFLLVPDS